MTTADWLRIPPQAMPIDRLVPVQPVQAHLLDGHDTSHCGDSLPHVVLWNGTYFISDGHHRVARSKRRGLTVLAVRLAIPGVHFHAD